MYGVGLVLLFLLGALIQTFPLKFITILTWRFYLYYQKFNTNIMSRCWSAKLLLLFLWTSGQHNGWWKIVYILYIVCVSLWLVRVLLSAVNGTWSYWMWRVWSRWVCVLVDWVARRGNLTIMISCYNSNYTIISCSHVVVQLYCTIVYMVHHVCVPAVVFEWNCTSLNHSF